MRSRITALAVFAALATALLAPAAALAWCNGPNGGDSFGTHDWIVQEANRLAGVEGAGWVNLKVALPRTDDPDTVFHDFDYHVYDIWGRHHGNAPEKVALYYRKAIAARTAGDITAASKYVGILAHYFGDICNPLHTDQSAAEDRMHGAYESAAQRSTDAVGEHRSWVRFDGYTAPTDVAGFTRAAATASHAYYAALVKGYNSGGMNSTVVSITRQSMNRAANGVADLIIALGRSAPAPSPSPSPSPSPAPAPSPSPSPTPSPAPAPSPRPSPAPSQVPTPSPSPSPSPSQVPTPTTTVIAPNGGESWTLGSVHNVTWSLSGAVSAGSFDLWAWSPTKGWAQLNSAPVATVANQTSYGFVWTITQSPASDYRIRVLYRNARGDEVTHDDSDSAFTLAPPVVTDTTSDLAVVGKYAYIADGVDGLRIVDVSDPQAPTAVGSCDTPGSATDVSVCGSYAYVADGDAGLQVVDVGDPAHPVIVKALQLPAAARRLCFSSGPLLADFESASGFSVSGGAMALDTAHVKHGAAAVKMSVAAGTTATLTRDNLGWDLSHAQGALQLWVYVKTTGGTYDESPPLVVMLSNANDSANYFSTGANYYVRDGWNLLRFSATDWETTGSPSWSRPIQRLRFVFSAPSDRSQELSFDELRVGERGLMPAFLWTFDDGYDELYQDVLPYLSPRGQKGTVYVTTRMVDGGGINISLAHLRALYADGWAVGNHTADHTDLAEVDQATAAADISACTTWLISHGFPRAAYHMAYPFNSSSASARAAAAQCGILTARRHGFRNQQVPVDEPLMLSSFGVESATPTIESWRAMIDSAVDSGGTLIFYGHYFTSANLPLFKQIADYVAQRRLWVPAIDEWWNTLAMQAESGEAGAGRYLYAACGDAGVQVIDVSDPAAPVLMGRCVTDGAATDVAAYDDGACVAAGSAGLQVVEALHPATPTLAGGLTGGSAPSQGICVRGDKTYIAAGADGLRIVSAADPAHPTLLGTLDTPGDARDVTVVGSRAYVADGPEGIQVIDVSDPARPALVGTHMLAAPAEALVVFGHTAYVVDGEGELQVVALSAGEG